FSRIDFKLKPHAGRWESGSLNVAGILSLGASVELLLGIGVDRLAARRVGLNDPPIEEDERGGRAGLQRGLPAAEGVILAAGAPRRLVRACRDHGVVINSRGGWLRVSPHVYNNMEEIRRLLEVLNNCR